MYCIAQRRSCGKWLCSGCVRTNLPAGWHSYCSLTNASTCVVALIDSSSRPWVLPIGWSLRVWQQNVAESNQCRRHYTTMLQYTLTVRCRIRFWLTWCKIIEIGHDLHNSLTHCCVWPAEGRSDLHNERSWLVIWARPTDIPQSSSLCCSHVLLRRSDGRFQSAAGEVQKLLLKSLLHCMDHRLHSVVNGPCIDVKRWTGCMVEWTSHITWAADDNQTRSLTVRCIVLTITPEHPDWHRQQSTNGSHVYLQSRTHISAVEWMSRVSRGLAEARSRLL